MRVFIKTLLLGSVIFSPLGNAADEAGLYPAGVIGIPAGSGRWPAVAEVRADLPTHTLYRPASLPDSALPLLVWGNGACRDNGLAHEAFLREIASHGYLVVALGRARRPGTDAARPAPPPGTDETDVAQMTEALEWAAARNADASDALAGHIDLEHIAVAGHSCGGLQAIKLSADARIDTSMIFNSGVYNTPGGRSGVKVDKQALDLLHGPISYFTGGPDDIAHANASDDAARIATVPVFFGWLPVGHGGTFSATNGGDWAAVAVSWLDWQLKSVAVAARRFAGDDCGLCTDQRWTVVRHP